MTMISPTATGPRLIEPPLAGTQCSPRMARDSICCLAVAPTTSGRASGQRRITAALALALIAEIEHKQLELVRRIRNQFAHEFSNVGFSDPAVKDLVQALPAHPVAMSSAENPTRRRFESAVEVLLSNLRYRVDEWSKREVPSATLPWFYPIDDSGAMKVSKKVELGVELRDPWLMSLAERAKKISDAGASLWPTRKSLGSNGYYPDT
jgi:hypothetical protein